MPSSPGIVTSSTTRSGRLSSRDAERLVAVGGEHDLEALGFEVPAHDVADMRFVVGDDDARLRRCAHGSRR